MKSSKTQKKNNFSCQTHIFKKSSFSQSKTWFFTAQKSSNHKQKQAFWRAEKNSKKITFCVTTLSPLPSLSSSSYIYIYIYISSHQYAPGESYPERNCQQPSSHQLFTRGRVTLSVLHGPKCLYGLGVIASLYTRVGVLGAGTLNMCPTWQQGR